MSICVSTINKMLAEAETSSGEKPTIQFRYANHHVNWNQIYQFGEGGAPSLDVGQTGNIRIPMDDGGAIHVHLFDQHGFARFHKDHIDPNQDSLGHLWNETNILQSGLLGGGLGGLASLAFGWPLRIVSGVCAVVGVIGATQNVAPSRVWLLQYYNSWSGEWRLLQVEAQKAVNMNLLPVR